MFTSRHRLFAVTAAIAALTCLLALAGPASAGRWRPPAKPNLALTKPALPVLTTATALINYVLPTLPLPLAPPTGALGAAPQEVLVGNAPIVTDPDYWADKWNRLTEDKTLMLPWPADLVKPELVLPNVRVAASDSRDDAWLLETEPVDVSAVVYAWNGRAYTVRDYMRNTETDAIAFLRNGKLVADYYANGYSPGKQHQPWSVTKSFISAVVGVARDEGHVGSLETPIEHYIPELRGTAWEGVSIYNLLTMQSGVHWDEGTPLLPQNTQVQQWVQVWLDYTSNGRLGQNRNEFLSSLPRDFPQGTKFSYNSGNTQVLAWMLEKIYGKPFNEILSQKLWQPAGMAEDASMIADRLGNVIASQGLYAIPYDFARFGELFRRGGTTPTGRRVVSQAWVDESTTHTALSGGSYAYQWWSLGGDPNGFSAGGFQGNGIGVSRSNCTVGVRLSHTLGAGFATDPSAPFDPTKLSFHVEMGGSEFDAMFAAVSRAIGGCPAT